MNDAPKYHDVICYADNVKYVPSNNYALMVTCTKVGGWELWYKWREEERLLASEYGEPKLAIEVKGMMVVGTKPETIEEPKPFGWDGTVVNLPNYAQEAGRAKRE